MMRINDYSIVLKGGSRDHFSALNTTSGGYVCIRDETTSPSIGRWGGLGFRLVRSITPMEQLASLDQS